MFGLNKNSFNYQIDIVVPNCETSFTELKENLFEKHKFCLLTQITLDKLVSRHFIDKFLKAGEIYLLSYNTKLDCHDCVCLLPNGNLVLHVEKSTYDQIPRKFNRITCKSTGFSKYEINLMLNELNDENERTKLENIFRKFCFSFYGFWKADILNNEFDLKSHFGCDHVVECLNRIECKKFQIPVDYISMLEELDLKGLDDWINIENLIGCLINNVKPEELIKLSEPAEKSSMKSISILRMKGFLPNKIIDDILRDYLQGLFELNESNKRIFIKLHGFIDSPVALFNLGSNNITNLRLNHENFLSVCCEKTNENIKCLFRDCNKCYLISF